MQTQTNITKHASAAESHQNSLYRLGFVGGPFDGHEAQSDDLPEAYLLLPLGPAANSSHASPGIAPRVARYKLASARLVMSCHVPIVLCRCEYCGTTTDSPSRRSLAWSRCLDALSRWFKTRPSAWNGSPSRRSSIHVQD